MHKLIHEAGAVEKKQVVNGIFFKLVAKRDRVCNVGDERSNFLSAITEI